MIEFDLRQLEYFVVAARTGSYSQASRELFVTPQAISRSIQTLESKIGMRLFERTPSGIVPTDFGRECLEPARHALDALYELQGMADKVKACSSRTVTMGIHSLCFEENGGSIRRSDLWDYQKKHEGSSLTFMEMAGGAIVEAVLEGTIDLGISVPPREKAEEFEHMRLKEFDVAALVSEWFPGHFAPANDQVTIEQLSNGEFVLFTEETEYNNSLLDAARAAKISLPISPLKISPHGEMSFLTGSNMYVTRPLQHALRTVHDGRLRILPIVDERLRRIQMPLEILMKRGRAATYAESELMDFVAKRYR
ncbi:MAG: LysR family transcriptional regulator [Coriobacteriales bacterium]|jgi:DNA-binding transcriptional LysR family regulator